MKTDDFIGYLETISAQVSPAQWSINLMDYQYNKRSDKCCYQFWRVNLQPEDALPSLVRDICNRYISDHEMLEAVEPYYGVTQARTIYTLESSNELIQTPFAELKQQLAQAGDFSSSDENKAKGYAISGEINIDETIIPVKIFNLSIPFKAVKHRFMMSAGEFKEIQSKLLTLQNSTCLIAIGPLQLIKGYMSLLKGSAPVF